MLLVLFIGLLQVINLSNSLTVEWGKQLNNSGSSTTITIPLTMYIKILHVAVDLQGSSITEDGNDKTRYHTYTIESSSTFKCGCTGSRNITYSVIGYQ